MMYDLFIAPFIEYEFMQRALIGALLISLGSGSIGVFLIARRMSLSGDAIAHAILPGVGVGYFISGLSLFSMTLGGIVAGLIVALGAGAVSRLTKQNEDASMAAFYLISLALGVLLISTRGSNVDLMHLLFGTILALNDEVLLLITTITSLTMLTLFLFWRGLIAECLDPLFLRSVSQIGSVVHFIFLILVVLNLVSGFQALGTLLSVGVMMVPAASARFWADRAINMCVIATLIGAVSSYVGLVASYHGSFPSGPSIILCAGMFYILSVLFSKRGIITSRIKPQKHRIG
jgi:zinc/manganese transport system permease protein